MALLDRQLAAQKAQAAALSEVAAKLDDVTAQALEEAARYGARHGCLRLTRRAAQA